MPDTANTAPVNDPAPQFTNTPDGPAGGDPDEFEALTGVSSNWELHEPDSEESGGGSVGAGTLAGGAVIASRPFWPALAAWFSGMFATPVLATIAGALYPSTAGGSVKIHEIAGTGHTVKINGDMTVGEVYDSEGNPTGISVIASGTDSNGSLVGFTPLTEQDAQALENLGVNISGGSEVIDTSPLLNENGDDEVDREPETGNSELDEVLTGSTATDAGNKGWETPQSVEEFEDKIRDIPGVEVVTHGGPGINATLPDGTKVSTYPARNSTGHAGYQIRSSEGVTTHKGSLVGHEQR